MGEIDFILQPDIYKPGASFSDLGGILEKIWSRFPPRASVYIASAFVDQNGVLPFVRLLKKHVEEGGDIKCFFAGSASQNMVSRQAIFELLSLPASVHLLNRKKIFHAKMYGICSPAEQNLVISSGNFTGNGLTLNVEASLMLQDPALRAAAFSWRDWEQSLLHHFDWHTPHLDAVDDPTDPAWKLTFDETHGRSTEQEDATATEDEILAFTLSPTDVNRIQDKTYPGTAYFWLSRYMSGYFPPLQIRSRPGAKKTFSTEIVVDFVDINQSADVTVTFEAYNNLDFRLLVGPLRGTRVASAGDIAILSRTGPANYKLRILKKNSQIAARIMPYLIHFIGNKGKRYGMVPKRFVRTLI